MRTVLVTNECAQTGAGGDRRRSPSTMEADSKADLARPEIVGVSRAYTICIANAHSTENVVTRLTTAESRDWLENPRNERHNQSRPMSLKATSALTEQSQS